MLVSPLESFAEYQASQAWTWEHQALIRARWIAGDPSLKDAFETVRRDILATAHDPDQVRDDLARMRQRQASERKESTVRRTLTDLQFIAELGVLQEAAKQPDLIETRSTPDQLHALAETGWLSDKQAHELESAWATLMRQRHAGWLLRDFSPDDLSTTETIVRTAWDRHFPTTGS